MNHEYLSVQDVLEIHEEQIEFYGGSHGVRDQAGLEAAIARPQSGYYDDLIAEAAALWESLSQNHPFIDGNKRTAFSSMNLFLGLNGIRIEAQADEVFEFISGAFERKEMKFDALEPWLRANTQARE